MSTYTFDPKWLVKQDDRVIDYTLATLVWFTKEQLALRQGISTKRSSFAPTRLRGREIKRQQELPLPDTSSKAHRKGGLEHDELKRAYSYVDCMDSCQLQMSFLSCLENFLSKYGHKGKTDAFSFIYYLRDKGSARNQIINRQELYEDKQSNEVLERLKKAIYEAVYYGKLFDQSIENLLSHQEMTSLLHTLGQSEGELLKSADDYIGRERFSWRKRFQKHIGLQKLGSRSLEASRSTDDEKNPVKYRDKSQYYKPSQEHTDEHDDITVNRKMLVEILLYKTSQQLSHDQGLGDRLYPTTKLQSQKSSYNRWLSSLIDLDAHQKEPHLYTPSQEKLNILKLSSSEEEPVQALDYELYQQHALSALKAHIKNFNRFRERIDLNLKQALQETLSHYKQGTDEQRRTAHQWEQWSEAINLEDQNIKGFLKDLKIKDLTQESVLALLLEFFKVHDRLCVHHTLECAYAQTPPKYDYAALDQPALERLIYLSLSLILCQATTRERTGERRRKNNA